VVSGILVTESGILAAAFGGAGSVKRYFKIMEKNISRMRTGLQYGVMEAFGGYDTINSR
jgi:hypothetical protein